MNVIIALILIAVAVFLIVVVHPKQKNSSTEMQYMKTKTVAELKEMFNQMTENGLGNEYREFVELKGKIVAVNPVKTPFSEREVAYCESEVLRVREEEERYRDGNGNMRTRTNRTETSISNERSSQEIYFKDSSTDEIIVLEANAVGCEFDLSQTFNRFEPTINLGKYNFFTARSLNNYGSDVVGFKMTEKTIDLDQDLYVIGEAFKVGDKIHIGKPSDKKKPFIVSTKSEEALVNKTKQKAMISLIVGIALAVLGVIIMLKK